MASQTIALFMHEAGGDGFHSTASHFCVGQATARVYPFARPLSIILDHQLFDSLPDLV